MDPDEQFVKDLQQLTERYEQQLSIEERELLLEQEAQRLRKQRDATGVPR